MEEGINYEITHYDKHDKVASITYNTIKDTKKEGTKQIAIIHTVINDEKGKETLNTDYEIICDGNNVTIDLNSMTSKLMASKLSSSEVEASVTGTNSVFPNNLKIGQSLPDAEMNMDVKTESMNMNFNVHTTNRKVTGEEKVTTPAGTFDCIIITSETESKMMITKKTTTKMWLAKGIGLVRQEEYNKKGELVAKQILTSFKN